jgi:pyocin large subunit-like protein
MKIIPVDDEIKEGDNLFVDNVFVEYVNYDGDCVSDAPQTLNIFTENNGVKRFIVFNTDRFAISNIDELIQIFNDFKKKAEL